MNSVRYVIDITQLIHWSGNLTGIPRVMDELAIRFATHDTQNTIFVSWVKEVNEMCEVDFPNTRMHRGNGIDYIRDKSNTLSNAGTSSRIHKLYRYKILIKKVAHKSGLSGTLPYKKIAGITHNIEAHSYKVYVPSESDKLFIPWGEWWDNAWLERVKSYHEAGVAVYPICHDILPMLVPQFSGNSGSLAEFVKQIFPIAATVLTPSESTKRDLKAWMSAHELFVPDIKPFRLGEDFTIKNVVVSDKDMIKKYAVNKDQYLISVGTIEPRKNHTLLYYAYKLAAARDITLPKLLIIGRIGHDTNEIIKFIREDPEMLGRIEIRNDVSDEELDWLYYNCMFTIQPSFYEGWGMPVIESIARGKSAICSNTSSLMEMPNDCVLRFHPASTDECLAAIQEMMDPATLTHYRKAVGGYKLHSWDDSFRQVITILGDN